MAFTEHFTSNDEQLTLTNSFIRQALSGYNAWWRYLITLLMVLVGWQMIGIVPIVALAAAKTKNTSDLMIAAQDNFMSLGIDKNLYLAVLIFMFFAGLMFLFLGVKLVHKRPIKTVLTSRTQFDWKRLLFGFGFWFLLSAIMIGVDYYTHPQDFIWNFKWQPFLILALISFLWLPFQTSFEEIFMRGYLMQGIGLLAKNRWLPLILTSLIFGLLHGANPEVAKIGNELLLYYIFTGLLFGIITLMDEGLELSMGIHAANNIVAALLVTTDWTVFQTNALLIDTSEPKLSTLMYVPLLIIYPIVLVILSKKYNWVNWKGKLLGKI